MFTMLPERRWIMSFSASRVQRNVPRRLTRSTWSHFSVLIMTTKPSAVAPALLTRMSRRLNRDFTIRIIARTWSSSATSACHGTAEPPARSISPTTSSACSWLREKLTTTVAPCLDSSRAVARPMPRLAPVTRATDPSGNSIEPPAADHGVDSRHSLHGSGPMTDHGVALPDHRVEPSHVLGGLRAEAAVEHAHEPAQRLALAHLDGRVHPEPDELVHDVGPPHRARQLGDRRAPDLLRVGSGPAGRAERDGQPRRSEGHAGEVGVPCRHDRFHERGMK